jgi:hypothetical protein
MKRWYQSKINWTQIGGMALTALPFLLDYLALIGLEARELALWTLAIQYAQSQLTIWLRNYKTDAAIGTAEEVAASAVLTRAFDEKNSGA